MRRRQKIRLGTFVTALVLVTGWGWYQSHQSLSAVQPAVLQAENDNERALYDLADTVSSLTTALQKARYAATPTLQSALLCQLISSSSGARQALACLDTSGESTGNVSKFFSQVEDYSVMLTRQISQGQTLTQEQITAITSLTKYGEELEKALQQIMTDFDSGHLTLSDEALGFSQTAGEGTAFSDALDQAAESFTGYPTLLYDGPFSDHILQEEPLCLSQYSEVTAEQAAEKAGNLDLGTGYSWEAGGEENGRLPCYVFQSGENRLRLTKAGGLLLSFSNPRDIVEEKLTGEEALEKACEILPALGFSDMQESYYYVADGVCMCLFFDKQGDVLCYPDLVKIGIATDDGSLVRVEAAGYRMNYQKRTALQPDLTAAQAQAVLSPQLTVLEAPFLCLIPSPGGSERLCWEFHCQGQEKEELLLYVNAKTGMEEQMYELQYSDSGTLTR